MNKTIYVIKSNVEYEIINEIVFLIKKQDHKIQNAMRKVKFKIPKTSKLELDAFGSFVFRQINGKNTIDDIASNLDSEFQEAAHPLYERLIPFLNYLCDNLRIIEIKEIKDGKI